MAWKSRENNESDAIFFGLVYSIVLWLIMRQKKEQEKIKIKFVNKCMNKWIIWKLRKILRNALLCVFRVKARNQSKLLGECKAILRKHWGQQRHNRHSVNSVKCGVTKFIYFKWCVYTNCFVGFKYSVTCWLYNKFTSILFDCFWYYKYEF